MKRWNPWFVWRGYFGQWWALPRPGAHGEGAHFATWREAYDYADRMARGRRR